MTIRNGRRFEALDSWRGVCAVLVSLGHLPALSHVFSMMLVRNSFFFVDFFFVLSGFVITHAYGSRLGTPRQAGIFLIKRIGRIWPLHVVALLAMIGLELLKLGLAGGPDTVKIAAFSGLNSFYPTLANLFLLHSLGILSGVSWNVPSWSISVEFGTYVVFAIAAVAFARRLPAFAWVAILASVAAIAALSDTYIDVTYDYGLLRCIYGFFLGYLTYRLRPFEGMTRSTVLSTVIEVSLVILIVLMVIELGASYLSLAAPLVFAAAVYVFSFQHGRISNLLKRPAFLFVGRVSYSLYMTHFVLCSLIVKVAGFVGNRLGRSLFVPIDVHGWSASVIRFGNIWVGDAASLVFIAASIGLSAITYRYVEMPGQRLFGRLAQSWSADRRNPPPDKAAGDRARIA